MRRRSRSLVRIQPVRLEVRRLEQHRRGRLADLGLLAAHDPGERDRALAVGDHQIGRRQVALDAVERPQALALACAADDDPPAVQRRVVERVQRVPEPEHHVVGDVDDVRDRPHAGREQPRLQPDRRRCDRDVLEQSRDVARAAGEVVDLHLDRGLRQRDRLAARLRRERQVVQRRHFARDPVDREQVGPVARRLEDHDRLAQRQHLVQRRAGLGAVGEQHDPGVVGAEVDLVLGQDHPVGDLAAHLPALERDPVREHGAGQRHGDGRPGAEVPRAADDRTRARRLRCRPS